MRELQEQLKAGTLTKEQCQAAEKKLNDETFTAETLAYLKANKSNAGFHYLGSGKVMTRIGEAFAKAMYDMIEKQKQN